MTIARVASIASSLCISCALEAYFGRNRRTSVSNQRNSPDPIMMMQPSRPPVVELLDVAEPPEARLVRNLAEEVPMFVAMSFASPSSGGGA